MARSSSPWTTYREVLNNREYMLLWLGQTVSQIGDAVSLVAVPLLVYQFTQSAVGLGMAFIIEAIPWILIGPLAGVLVDRTNRRVVLVAVDLIRMGLMLSLFVAHSVWHVYAVGFLSQTAATIFAPARSAVIPELTGKDLYVKAISLSYTSYQLVQVIGPVVATLLIGWMGGPKPAFLLDAATFLAAVLMTLAIRFPASVTKPGTDKVRQTFWASFRVGTAFIVQNPVLRYATGINVLKGLATACFLTGTVLYTETALDLGSAAGNRLYGTAIAAASLGAAVGAWAIGAWEKRFSRLALITSGQMAQGLFYVLILLHPGPYSLVAVWAVAGLFSSGAITPVSACYAEATPNEIRGRVYSVTNSVLRLVSMAAFAAAGWVGDAFGPVILLAGAGAVLLVLTPIVTLATGAHRTLTTALRRAPGA